MYENRYLALQAKSESMLERNVALWVYQCDECSYWHLTSRPPIPASIRTKYAKPRSGKRGYRIKK